MIETFSYTLGEQVFVLTKEYSIDADCCYDTYKVGEIIELKESFRNGNPSLTYVVSVNCRFTKGSRDIHDVKETHLRKIDRSYIDNQLSELNKTLTL